MLANYIPIAAIFILGVISHNQSVAAAAAVLIIVKACGLTAWLATIEHHGLNIGITILVMAILAPVAAGRVSLTDMFACFKTPLGFFSILVGIFVAWAGGLGIPLLKDAPQVVTSIIIGTIIGVFFFKGVPVGPLIASGLIYIALSVAKLLR